MTRIYRLLCIPLVLALLLANLTPVALASLSKPDRLKIMSSVVQIWWIWQEQKGLRGSGMGSGTIVSADGLVLTNYHVAFPEKKLGVTHLGIALTTRSDQ
ncbi:MAG: Trypsin-like peptidase protein, partial [Chloroflexota bacterium]|nr:Trypsin-like peptidase protein [Chloroflexota bacterium]